jgi:hypothetical protein
MGKRDRSERLEGMTVEGMTDEGCLKRCKNEGVVFARKKDACWWGSVQGSLESERQHCWIKEKGLSNGFCSGS